MKILATVLVSVWLIFVMGCASPYKTLSAMNYLEQGAVRTAAELYDAGKISDADWERVVVADELFGQAWTSAVKAAKDAPEKPAPVEVKVQALSIAEMVAKWEVKQ